MTLLFDTDGVRGVALGEAELPRLQAFFEANPTYFETVNGSPVRPDEARQEFDDLPPPEMPFRQRWIIGLEEPGGQLQGIAIVLADFIVPAVWHVALFIVDTTLHGSGVAGRAYRALEDWMRGQGANWLRLGAVVGNARAERFWPKMGYHEVRQRHGMQTGLKTSTVIVFVKPLGGRSLDDYLGRMARDRPDEAP
jgi:GNAT superfamily N-acetyltransferase